ncbi:tetratricopeptide repeat protein [Sphingomicrobium marinum]|uniref:tetratricopeptide repeat protein n=1 Tax=Sphingomicrobium marinum TaxID=1227950 RepID=UPI00223F2F45|nr:tetratricopeptide repeat protein [Sphingomicrobium marinum]
MATAGLTEEQQTAVKRFETEVMKPSMDKLVIVQFTASWCGPCKQLSPVLEQVAADYADKGVMLAKVDIDEQKFIAQQFRIQSVPTVYSIYQGQPVADLTQYRTPGAIKQALDQVLAQLPVKGEGADQEEQLNQAIAMGEDALDNGAVDDAMAIFTQLQQIAPDHPKVIGGLARTHLEKGDKDAAAALLEGVDSDDPAISRVRAMLEVTGAPTEAAEPVDTSALTARIEKDADDHEARFELAQALMASGDRDGAADQLLESIQRDREWNDGAAKTKFLQLLEAAGLEDDWSSKQRRRLSAVLFT